MSLLSVLYEDDTLNRQTSAISVCTLTYDLAIKIICRCKMLVRLSSDLIYEYTAWISCMQCAFLKINWMFPTCFVGSRVENVIFYNIIIYNMHVFQTKIYRIILNLLLNQTRLLLWSFALTITIIYVVL